MSLGDFKLSKNNRHGEYRFLLLFMQLGLTVVSPIVLCLLIAVFLKNSLDIPDLVTVLLILLGVAGGILGALRLLIKADRKDDKKGEDGDESK